MNQARKIGSKQNKDVTSFDIAKQIFDIYKEINDLRDKETKRKKELMLDNLELSNLLDNILNESEILMITKLKKVKKEMMLNLLDDITEHIDKYELVNDNIIKNDCDQIIELKNLTYLVFNPKQNFIVEKGIMYKCNKINFCKISDILRNFEDPDPMIFNIETISDDIHVKNDLKKMIEIYNN